MNGDSILLVEDDKEIRQGVEIFLRSQGYQVFQAENGLEGLKILEERPIDLAIDRKSTRLNSSHPSSSRMPSSA